MAAPQQPSPYDFTPDIRPVPPGPPPPPAHGLLGDTSRTVLQAKLDALLNPPEAEPEKRGAKVMRYIGSGLKAFASGAATAGNPTAQRAMDAIHGDEEIMREQQAAKQQASQGELDNIARLLLEDAKLVGDQTPEPAPPGYTVDGYGNVVLAGEDAVGLARMTGANKAVHARGVTSEANTVEDRRVRAGQGERRTRAIEANTESSIGSREEEGKRSERRVGLAERNTVVNEASAGGAGGPKPLPVRMSDLKTALEIVEPSVPKDGLTTGSSQEEKAAAARALLKRQMLAAWGLLDEANYGEPSSGFYDGLSVDELE